MANITVNFKESAVGNIRPLHGVNAGPMTKAFTYDARPLFRESGIPFARLHDVEYPYGSGEFVDIPCIFKNFDADENLPESYNFELTDEYIRYIVEVGCEPLFRLGISIEHAPVKRYVCPPKDYQKWSRICEHIIRHYNEGWADGYHWNIRYWEIWNESDGRESKMWGGTPEQFYELYCVSATHLKKCFPELMIGGCGYTRELNPFIENFFRYITAKPYRVPLDFYSWHRYFSEIDTMLKSAAAARELLARYGYDGTESVFDEWNYMRDWDDQADSYPIIKNHIGAAYCGAVLCALQSQTDVDVATYFEGDVVKEWCGLFEVKEMSIGTTKATVGPLKPFYTFKAFNELYKMKNAKPVECSGNGLYSCAAGNDERAAVMVANYHGDDREVEFELSGIPDGTVEVRMVDDNHDFETVMSFGNCNELKLCLPMKSNSFVYIGSSLKE